MVKLLWFQVARGNFLLVKVNTLEKGYCTRYHKKHGMEWNDENQNQNKSMNL